MQNELTPGANSLQPQSSSLQQGQAGLQQTGGVTASDDTTSLLSEQPKTDQLRVVTQGQPSTTALTAPVQSSPPIGLWVLFAVSFLCIAIGGLILRWRSNVTPLVFEPAPDVGPEPLPAAPVTSAKPTKSNKKQSRKKRTSKR